MFVSIFIYGSPWGRWLKTVGTGYFQHRHGGKSIVFISSRFHESLFSECKMCGNKVAFLLLYQLLVAVCRQFENNHLLTISVHLVSCSGSRDSLKWWFSIWKHFFQHIKYEKKKNIGYTKSLFRLCWFYSTLTSFSGSYFSVFHLNRRDFSE